ncbi:hypothetical protein TGRUB_431630 [Toxoplasma gondii RUB]|uniref:Uncharacterized protein n=1 Tax=Toxoplasma gondii RUB TaxID=935652 RepID=A0A086LWE5_TOXGO|nr:hypothetical protein TGRUB_431630 [Toxoplasma gondii RUB]
MAPRAREALCSSLAPSADLSEAEARDWNSDDDRRFSSFFPAPFRAADSVSAGEQYNEEVLCAMPRSSPEAACTTGAPLDPLAKSAVTAKTESDDNNRRGKVEKWETSILLTKVRF